LRGVLLVRAPLLHITSGGKPMEDLTITKLLRTAVALMLDKLNEHNPETGYLFATDHRLTEYLTMLTLVHACARDAIPMARALETIRNLEENNHARHARNH
jgi:hypothetical protein